jgi:hypothetical protein
MKIVYLKSMEAHPAPIDPEMVNEGFTVAQIKELEDALNNGNSFPTVLREYLFLGGEFSHIGVVDTQRMLDGTEQYLVMNESYQNRLKEAGLTLDRPIFIFYSYDGDGFSFVYLDEGDDPQPHHFGIDPSMRGENGELIYDFPQKTFSELVDKCVERALNGLPPR